jgi:hypothetical protein
MAQRLVLRPLHGQPDVAHLVGEARQRFADLRLGLGGGVGGLDRLLAGAEGLDLGREALRRLRQLRLLGQQLGVLGLERLELRLDGRPAGEGLPGQVLPVGGHGPPGLFEELGRLGLQLLALELEALAGGDDVDEAPLHLLQHLQLALVRVVERLPGILHPVDGLVGLGFEDRREPLPEPHGRKR